MEWAVRGPPDLFRLKVIRNQPKPAGTQPRRNCIKPNMPAAAVASTTPSPSHKAPKPPWRRALRPPRARPRTPPGRLESANSLGRSWDGSLSQSKTVTRLNLRMGPLFRTSCHMAEFSRAPPRRRNQRARRRRCRNLGRRGKLPGQKIAARRTQQMRGSGSPDSQSTMRRPPKRVRIRTKHRGSAVTLPIQAAVWPSGWARIAAGIA